MIELLYFQSPGCGVCHALRPKLEQLLASEFPNLTMRVIDSGEDRETPAQHMVFISPVLIIKLDGREYTRFVRAFSVGEVEEKLHKVVEALEAEPWMD